MPRHECLIGGRSTGRMSCGDLQLPELELCSHSGGKIMGRNVVDSVQHIV